MNAYAKPLPRTDVDTQPFWDACKLHQLRAQRCSDCRQFRWPPQA
ncbi:MAG: zinc ribbon domain-containing protein, partial [Candidatus Binatia bacterium]